MAASLNVIALISGGKDSFFSLLHCVQNGHKVIALGNLYPPTPKHGEDTDLNSFMYQTVGHTVIPLYEQALGIPLYRQEIVGGAVQTGISYAHSDVHVLSSGVMEDETESLVPLLEKIMKVHPQANALSTGAILSTYQRTRVESVALRLGLTPLSYLWQYPSLPPCTQTSLLQDMQAVGLEARIVKVASGGLDESFLWENVASDESIRKVERSMRRFGTDGDGAVLGEGGEFETLVVDGPGSLFKGRIEILEQDRRVIREGGGAAWLQILDAKVVMKATEEATKLCRIPDLLEQKFSEILETLTNDSEDAGLTDSTVQFTHPVSEYELGSSDSKISKLSSLKASRDNTVYWTVTGHPTGPSHTITDSAIHAIQKIKTLLQHSSLDPSAIISTMIILRSMQDFAAINTIYGSLFTAPNPPSRITISCGPLMPTNTEIIIHLRIHTSTAPSPRKALHVQSRSYWAPANIGPYSQATSIPTPSSDQITAITIAGQIPLVPSSMAIVSSPSSSAFKTQTVLALQHLCRIAESMSVCWLSSAMVYLPAGQRNEIVKKAVIAGKSWARMHRRGKEDEDDDEGEEEVRDLWEERHFAGKDRRRSRTEGRALPDWESVDGAGMPPFWAAEVKELPRGAGVEWCAGVGVVGGRVDLNSEENNPYWRLSQCRFANTVQSIIMVSHTEHFPQISERIDEALLSAGIEIHARAHISYIDVTITGIEVSTGEGRFGGFVPCRSIWDAEGSRLAAVVVFDTAAKI